MPSILAGGRAAKMLPGRILCLKLDHVGDLLIAAPALLLLRKSFPDAEITIICAPWNAGLVRRLGIADHILESSFFSQNSLLDMDSAARDERRRASLTELQSLQDKSFDLAIDLRRDEDTRPLLKLFDSSIRAGMGDLATYSYLDIAMPVTHLGTHVGASSLHARPEDLASGSGHRISDSGLHLTSNQGRATIDIATDALWSPSENGTSDNRLLGVALTGIFVRQRRGSSSPEMPEPLAIPVELARNDMAFGPGWLAWEPWGRWSNAEKAHVELDISTADPDVELIIRVQGHTGSGHPAALVEVHSNVATVSHLFTQGEEAATLRLPCHMEAFPPAAKSSPALLRAGRYRGTLRVSIPTAEDWESVRLAIRGERLGNIIAQLDTPYEVTIAGILDFPFEVELLDTGDPIRIEISVEGRHVDRRLAIVSVDLWCMQARSLLLPVTHMEQQLQDLAALVALRCADQIVKPTDAEIAKLLSASRKGSTAEAARQTLRKLRGNGSWFSRKRTTPVLIGIGIGANKETKLWPAAHWSALCRRLLDQQDVTLIFVGGPAEQDAVAALLSELDVGDRAIDLCACCKIEDLGEVLAKLDGFIGLDTGTTHFAGRVGLKTLALFGPAHDPLEWGPVGLRSGWVTEEIPCSSCFLSEARQCAIDVACMDRLTPECVWPMVERHVLGREAAVGR